MAAKNNPISERILNNLAPDIRMHFQYHGLFMQDIDVNDHDSVEQFFKQNYLNNLSLEEFAISICVEKINEEMKKYRPKPKQPEKVEKSDKVERSENKQVTKSEPQNEQKTQGDSVSSGAKFNSQQ